MGQPPGPKGTEGGEHLFVTNPTPEVREWAGWRKDCNVDMVLSAYIDY